MRPHAGDPATAASKARDAANAAAANAAAADAATAAARDGTAGAPAAAADDSVRATAARHVHASAATRCAPSPPWPAPLPPALPPEFEFHPKRICSPRMVVNLSDSLHCRRQ